MGDIYTEQLIKRKKTGKVQLIKGGLLSVTIAAFVLGLLSPYFILAFLAMIGVDIYAFRSMDVEYEYSYINGCLDIDKIMSKARRKKMFEMNVSELEIMAPSGSPQLVPFQGVKAVDYTSGESGKRIYEMILVKNGVKKKILFEPNDTIVEGMYMYGPRKVIRVK